MIPKNVLERAKCSVADLLAGKGHLQATTDGLNPPMTKEELLMEARRMEDEDKAREREKAREEKSIFDGLVIYINGSTSPLISDHKLKHILAENGAKISIALGRRQVTHVILGRPCGSNNGAGGGLAGGKLEKEIKRVGGCGVKYVGVEW